MDITSDNIMRISSISLLAAAMLQTLAWGLEPARVNSPQIDLIKKGDHFLIVPNSKESGADDFEVSIPIRFDEVVVRRSIQKAVWNSKKTACVISLNSDKGSFLAALFFKQKILMKVVDLSRIENANISKQGKALSDLKSYSTVATEWLDRSDNFLQVRIVTTVKYSDGSSVNSEEKQIFTEEGVPIWR